MNKHIERLNKSFIFDNRILIYSLLLYAGGIIIACVFYKSFGFKWFKELLNNLFLSNTDSFLDLFFNKLSVYLSVFITTVLFGLCIIGYPLVYSVPIITGFIITLKIAFYYTNFKVKGIGYCLLMIIPESAAFESLLLLTICNSANLSKLIYDSTINKKDMTEGVNLKSYLKSYLINFIIIVAIAAINSILSYFINTIITL